MAYDFVFLQPNLFEMIRWFIVVVLLLINSHAQSQETPGKTFGGWDNDVGLTICQASDGGFLIAGTTRSFGAGSNDIYLVRIDKNGTVIWTRTIGWKHQDAIRSVIAVDDGFILAGDVWDYGFYRLDIYMMKVDNYGYVVWDQFYGTNSSDLGFKVIPSDDNGYLILGHSTGIEPRGDLLLIKTDHDGNQEWSQNYGSEYDDYGFDLVQQDNGSILMIGSKGGFFETVHANFKNHDADIYVIKSDKNGNEQWQKTFGGNEHDFGQAISISGDGGFFLFGSSQSYGAGSFDMTLIKTNPEFDEVWRKTYGGLEYEYGMSMDKNAHDDLFLFGTTKSFGLNESADFYLIKTDNTGEEIWNLIIGGNETELGHQVIATADSGCIVIGQTNSFGEGGFDFLLTKIDKNGLIEYFINGIDTTFEGELLVYPNPVRGYGKVKFKSTSQPKNYRMELILLNGSVRSLFTIYPPDYDFNTINLSQGFYIYRIISEETSEIIFAGKLVVH